MNKENLLIKNIPFPKFDFLDETSPMIIAGPCSIESKYQAEEVAQKLVDYKIKIMRGGAFKPRTSPYDFQGLGIEGLDILNNIRKKYGLLIISEILDVRDIELGLRYTDIIQIGSRNMYNAPLLTELGITKHPVLLKRGMMATLSEFMYAAEYILKGGNNQIILCERGIRTFETSVRNTLDISTIAILKKEIALPIIVDLSHSLGRKDIILPIAKAVLALGVDGIMFEVHNNPKISLSDSKQQLSFEELDSFLNKLLCFECKKGKA